jgi:hypothetical protein
MPKISIEPASVLVAPGQSVVFTAQDDSRVPCEVTWRLDPGTGTVAAPGGQPGSTTQGKTAVYAPPIIQAARILTLIAETADASATATISLTPDLITIVPGDVELGADQVQEFRALVAGKEDANVLWELKPHLGELHPSHASGGAGKIRYHSPRELRSSGTVSLIASLPTATATGTAKIRLTMPPWTGVGVQVLGIYTLAVFCLVFLLVGLWPPTLPGPDIAHAERIEAENALQARERELDLVKQTPSSLAATPVSAPASALPSANGAGGSAGRGPGPAPSANAAARGGAPGAAGASAEAHVPANANGADKQTPDGPKPALERAEAAVRAANKELKAKEAVEQAVRRPDVPTWFFGMVGREVDLLWLVLLGGALGGFLHLAQSFSEYVGNSRLRRPWAWWYALRPFIGAVLALVFYAALRGGFLALSLGAPAKPAELNPFGLVSIAAIVGLFSRMATVKLGEVFDTLFKSQYAKTKDQLDHFQALPEDGGGTGADAAKSAGA